MILSENYDSDDFDEQKAYGTKEEKIVVNRDNFPQKNKRQQWKNKGPKEESKQAYGNSYGRKGQVNNTSLITNDDLKASMWQSNGFIVDRNLNKLAHILKEKGVDCLITNYNDSE